MNILNKKINELNEKIQKKEEEKEKHLIKKEKISLKVNKLDDEISKIKSEISILRLSNLEIILDGKDINDFIDILHNARETGNVHELNKFIQKTNLNK